MKRALKNVYYSFPIQLLLLHFRKSQILLFFWLILFLTVTGNFMKLFGADALFLAPEYLGRVNSAASFIVGIAAGVYTMSWNITTFIIHSTRCRFLATTSNPFLKYCLNNAIIPVAFLIVYFIYAFRFDVYNELLTVRSFLLLAGGFTAGFTLLLLISFAYFFTADRRINRSIKLPSYVFTRNRKKRNRHNDHHGLRVQYYLNTLFKFKKARDVSHYGQTILDDIFKRHHFSAIITIFLAFLFMLLVGFYLDKPVFQVPAAASILIMFAVLLAVLGALSYFLRSWSLLFLIGFYLLINTLYKQNIIDTRNKAYGLDYDRQNRPAYSLKNLQSLHSPQQVQQDKENMLSILGRWKAKQGEEKPLMVFFNFSGGGLRGASFSMRILQQLDSVTRGSLMHKTVMMTGASGGMLAATYYRELSRLRAIGELSDINGKNYLNNISKDLLNPVFSAMVSRDIFGPSPNVTLAGHTYSKDRAYGFEQKLNENTGGLLDKNLGFYKEPEARAQIPLLMMSSVVTRDLRKMIISPQPISFLMQEEYKDSTSRITGPDAIDFAALFKNENPLNLRILTALRMNATYPYVLPAVWLPTDPVIDVMDAGLRDNNGQETTLRFIDTFRDWIEENTRGLLIIQIRSRQKGSWDEMQEEGGISEILSKPFTMLQDNWFVLQDYFQDDELNYLARGLHVPLKRVAFMYVPEKKERGASLNFHLTTNEKLEVERSINRPNNREALEQVLQILH